MQLKLRYRDYGWRDGKLILDNIKLVSGEKEYLKDLTEIALKEIAERTRMGSGDDQYYVEKMYDQLKANTDNAMLVEIVFKLLKRELT